MSDNIKCASCDSDTEVVYNFGLTGLAGEFPRFPNSKKYPLVLYKCKGCDLLQVNQIATTEELFSDYRYISSLSMSEHFGELADWALFKFPINDKSVIYDIGCNDGAFLNSMRNRGVNCKGVDPAKNIVKLGTDKGLDIDNAVFNSGYVKSNRLQNSADYIFCSNCFAHVPRLNGFVEGFNLLLKENGFLVIEVNDSEEMIEQTSIDFIYHEHVYYYTLHSLQKVLNRHGLFILGYEKIKSHGGSIRVIVTKLPIKHNFPKLDSESFEKRIFNKLSLNRIYLSMLKDNFKTQIGYGASGRAVSMINFLKLNKNDIPFVIDDSPERQGRFIAGTDIPVISKEKALTKGKFDNVIIFPWNVFDQIVKQLEPKLGKPITLN